MSIGTTRSLTADRASHLDSSSQLGQHAKLRWRRRSPSAETFSHDQDPKQKSDLPPQCAICGHASRVGCSCFRNCDFLLVSFPLRICDRLGMVSFASQSYHFCGNPHSQRSTRRLEVKMKALNNSLSPKTQAARFGEAVGLCTLMAGPRRRLLPTVRRKSDPNREPRLRQTNRSERYFHSAGDTFRCKQHLRIF